jgi:hypothetical protein
MAKISKALRYLHEDFPTSLPSHFTPKHVWYVRKTKKKMFDFRQKEKNEKLSGKSARVSCERLFLFSFYGL